MTDETPGPDPEVMRKAEELALERWPEIVDAIDAMVKRFQDQVHTAQPGSSLASDDRLTAPYHTSHVIQMLLNAGIDNLNGVRHLIWGRPGEQASHPVLHQAAHYVLARAAIENFATALWILEPPSRPLRVERTLRWHVKNASDHYQAVDELDLPPSKPTAPEKLTRLEAIAAQALGGIPKNFRKGYYPTHVVQYASDSDPRNADRGLSTMFIWRLCSGFAHGRPWASLAFQEQDIQPTDDPDVMAIRMTSDLTRALLPPKEAVHLLERILKMYDLRSQRA